MKTIADETAEILNTLGVEKAAYTNGSIAVHSTGRIRHSLLGEESRRPCAANWCGYWVKSCAPTRKC